MGLWNVLYTEKIALFMFLFRIITWFSCDLKVSRSQDNFANYFLKTKAKRSSNVAFFFHSMALIINGKLNFRLNTGCPNEHGNSVTNSISSFQIILRFSLVIPTEKAVICKSFVCYVHILFVYVLTTYGCT